MIHLTETKAAVMTGAALIGGTIGQVFGGMDAALITLLIFMAIDYVSGLIVEGMSGVGQKRDWSAQQHCLLAGTLEKRDDAGDCACGCASGYRAGHSVCP